MLGLSRNPEKYEAKALKYEQKGNTTKALKMREKAQQLRGHQAVHGPQAQLPKTTTRTYTQYETKAVGWENRQNWAKAQKNREKAWRLQYPQHATATAPQFYQNNRFVGYNVPITGTSTTSINTTVNTTGIAAHTVVAPTITETHVRPVIVDQTVRTEKITEVQPIIHREVEAPHVKVIEKHMYETVPSTGPHTITNQAIVEETVKPRIIEEIQPVVHRNVAQTYVEKVEQHVTEHIVKPTTTSKEVIQDTTVHTVGAPVGVAVGGGATVGLGKQTTTQTTTTTGPGINQTHTTTTGAGGVHSHGGLANPADTTLAGQHNATHASQVKKAL